MELNTIEYVMVPVPEDLVEDFDGFMKWIVKKDSESSGKEQELLEAGVGAYLAAAPPARHFLATVARAAVDQVPISLADAAAEVGLGLHEAMGMVGEANINYVQLEGRGAMVFPAPNPVPIPEGCPAWAHNVMAMHPDVAEELLDL